MYTRFFIICYYIYLLIYVNINFRAKGGFTTYYLFYPTLLYLIAFFTATYFLFFKYPFILAHHQDYVSKKSRYGN